MVGSAVVLYTKDKKILMQERRSFSRYGEEWSYFGGGSKENETPKQTAFREIKEELEYELKNPVYLGAAIGYYEGIKVTSHVFIELVDEDLNQFILNEGDSMKFLTVEEIRKLKLAPGMDTDILDMVEEYLNKNESN